MQLEEHWNEPEKDEMLFQKITTTKCGLYIGKVSEAVQCNHDSILTCMHDEHYYIHDEHYYIQSIQFQPLPVITTSTDAEPVPILLVASHMYVPDIS